MIWSGCDIETGNIVRLYTTCSLFGSGTQSILSQTVSQQYCENNGNINFNLIDYNDIQLRICFIVQLFICLSNKEVSLMEIIQISS